MSESRSQVESQPNAGGHPDGDVGKEKHKPRWLVAFLIATIVLVIMAVGACFLYGRELFQRPFLIVAVVVAWPGALVGLSIGSDRG